MSTDLESAMNEKTPRELNDAEKTLKDEALPEPPTQARRETFRDVLSRLQRDLGTAMRMLEELPYDCFSAGRVSFEVVRVLEERSNGEQVLLAERRLRHGLAGYVVVKRLHEPARFELKQRLIEEVQLAFRLHHPVIAQVHHLRVLEKVPYVIMEYVDGRRLDSLISAAAILGRALPAPFVLYLASEVADALHYAHTLTEEEEAGRPLGIIHRDVSPRNIRVDGKTGAVKLMDFGAAFSTRVRARDTSIVPHPGNFVGVSGARSYHSTRTVAVVLWLRPTEEKQPWRAVRAELVGPGRRTLRVHPPWQREPLRPGVKDQRVVIEADATEAESRGSFTLRVWNEDGTRSLIVSGVSFP